MRRLSSKPLDTLSTTRTCTREETIKRVKTWRSAAWRRARARPCPRASKCARAGRASWARIECTRLPAEPGTSVPTSGESGPCGCESHLLGAMLVPPLADLEGTAPWNGVLLTDHLLGLSQLQGKCPQATGSARLSWQCPHNACRLHSMRSSSLSRHNAVPSYHPPSLSL